jgi:hypothetical protein
MSTKDGSWNHSSDFHWLPIGFEKMIELSKARTNEYSETLDCESPRLGVPPTISPDERSPADDDGK